MTNEQTHIVDRLRIELKVSSPEQAHEIQEEISQLVEQKLKAMLNDLFEQLPSDQTVVIDRLQFDLGALSSGRLSTQFMEKLQKKVKQKMPDFIYADRQEAKEIQQFSKEELYWETFRHYLLTGTYPWFVCDHSDAPILKDPKKLFEMVYKQEQATLADFLTTRGSDPEVRKRIIYLLDDEHFQMLNIGIFAGVRDYEPLKEFLVKAGANPATVQSGLRNVQLALLATNRKILRC
ncbi:MAG: contractile injection system tape measure protein [Balneolaceae bacterium]|nr:contractile injection system tape measure protein [Balneolaceae bacterium]